MLIHSPYLSSNADRNFLRGCSQNSPGNSHPSCPCRMSYLSLKNFLALCASTYYDGCLFHRNIKGFMTQAGDPTGTGKGGQSIWGKPFPDEIRSTLKVLFYIHSPLQSECSRLGYPWRLCSSSIPLTVQRPWRRCNGKFWPRYQQVSVLHRIC
jgi:Cyclophilin type peptidyl-prolyl cis-trans isomerase/CLD